MEYKLKFVFLFVIIAMFTTVFFVSCSENKPNNDVSLNTNDLQDDISDVSQIVISSEDLDDAQNIGEGNTVFKFEVVDAQENSTIWNVHTDELTVGDALIEVGLIEGETSAFGLYVKKVNGISADFDADKAYWAFFIDGEIALKGVDSTNIESDKTYAFIYTKA